MTTEQKSNIASEILIKVIESFNPESQHYVTDADKLLSSEDGLHEVLYTLGLFIPHYFINELTEEKAVTGLDTLFIMHKVLIAKITQSSQENEQ